MCVYILGTVNLIGLMQEQKIIICGLLDYPGP